MVGVFFFLIEFYGGDKLLAFGVLTIVWVCQVFGIIAIRSIQGMRFFPKIFFLLFTLFHVYYFSCPSWIFRHDISVDGMLYATQYGILLASG